MIDRLTSVIKGDFVSSNDLRMQLAQFISTIKQKDFHPKEDKHKKLLKEWGISEQESVALALFGQEVEYIETMKYKRKTQYCQKQG